MTLTVMLWLEAERKEEGRDQESIQSSTTPYPGYHKGNCQENIKYKSQEVSPFPAGDHKAVRNRQDSTTKSNMEHR